LAVGLLLAAPRPARADDERSARSRQARTAEIHKRYCDRILDLADVVGTGVSDDVTGRPVIRVFATNERVRGLPATLDGVPVEVEVTGKIVAMGPPQSKARGGNSSAARAKIDPTTWFPRPVPIGISTGNIGECSAGTIGCRITDGFNVYALSNNHVYALENFAPLASVVLQPGRYDTNCIADPDDSIGVLYDFIPMNFDGLNNTVDAAIALSSVDDLGTSTPSNGYGLPKSAIVSAFVGQKVQKYGRTTSLTKGQVTTINATVNVGYGSGTARFVNQIIVQSRKPVIKPGDSGSLLVTDPGRNPVGLMFAGTADGKLAVANRIDLVLEAFDDPDEGIFMTIDGE
jgi:hypothetical protein